MKLELGGYVLDVDVERTRQSYLAISKGGAESCGCANCRNYLALLPNVLPEPVRLFLSAAGVDVHKDAEVYEHGEVAPGLRSYGGEYYLWGSVLAGPAEAGAWIGVCQFWFTEPTPLAQEEFRSAGALCFQFETNLPWVLNESA